MDVKEAIKRGRSIRAYKDKDVSDDLINELIDAVRLAPSGNNAQPWVFKIIKSKKEKDQLKRNKIFVQDFVCAAPVLIVCCTNPEVYPPSKIDSVGDDYYEKRAIRDLSIAAQNMILRATELGLGTWAPVMLVGWIKRRLRMFLEFQNNWLFLM